MLAWVIQPSTVGRGQYNEFAMITGRGRRYPSRYVTILAGKIRKIKKKCLDQ